MTAKGKRERKKSCSRVKRQFGLSLSGPGGGGATWKVEPISNEQSVPAVKEPRAGHFLGNAPLEAPPNPLRDSRHRSSEPPLQQLIEPLNLNDFTQVGPFSRRPLSSTYETGSDSYLDWIQSLENAQYTVWLRDTHPSLRGC